MITKASKFYFEYPKNIYFKNSQVLSAPNWFFILTTGRTGSTVLTKILNLHKDIYCANEQNALHLFSTILQSKIYVHQKPRLRYTYQNQKELNIADLRKLMEAWKDTQTTKKLFGDKDWLYGEEYSKLIDQVFPQNKKILTTRNILDQLSSLYSQDWYKKIPIHKFDKYKHILNDVKERIVYNKKWSKEADITIPFENFAIDGLAKQEIFKILDIFEVSKDKFPINKAMELCDHRNSICRWKTDKIIIDFLKQLKIEDKNLFNILTESTY